MSIVISLIPSVLLHMKKSYDFSIDVYGEYWSYTVQCFAEDS